MMGGKRAETQRIPTGPTIARFYRYIPVPLLPICMGTHFFQNGDPMGTQFLVKWGPNGDPCQQNGDPKSACLQN